MADQADPWAIFGGDDDTPSVVQVPLKRPRDTAADDAARKAALRPFADARGGDIVVPAPPTPQRLACADGAPSTAPCLAVWPEYPPHVVGPLTLKENLDGVGGARGFVAEREVQPGEVLMAESPVVAWPSRERGPLPLLHSLLDAGDGAIFDAVHRLHPESLDLVDPQEWP